MNSLKNIRWIRVFSNAGVAFFTTLVGIELSGLTDPITAARIAVIPALINAGLAFFTELKDEAEFIGKHTKRKVKLKGKRSLFLLF